VTIDQMLELCKLANVVHFPQGVVVVRQDEGGFLAGIETKDVAFYPLRSTNKTAEGALDDLKNYVTVAARTLVDNKAREAESVRAAVLAAEGAKP
jgi:hypothetical protein